MKKASILLAAVLSLCTLSACSSGSAYDLAKLPEFNTDHEFYIGEWGTPGVERVNYELLAEAGFTSVNVEEMGDYSFGSAKFDEIMGWCDELGLDVIVCTNAGGMNNPLPELPGGLSVDGIDVSQYPAAIGINYWDEPYLEGLDSRVKPLVDYHLEKYGDTDLLCYVNLYPITGGNLLGDYAEYYEKYEEVCLNRIPAQQGFISSDLYPFLEDNGDTMLHTSWLPTLEQTAQTARKHPEAMHHFFIQAVEHTGPVHYRDVGEEEFRMQFNVAMAYGVDAISYFTFVGDGGRSGEWMFENSALSREDYGATRPQYEAAKTVNAEIKKIEDVYLDFDWTGAYTVVGTQNADGMNIGFDALKYTLDSLDCASQVRATQDTLIGQFERESDGLHALQVVNYTDPADGLEDLVEITFSGDYDAAMVYIRGEMQIYQVLEGRTRINLKAGEGAFVIPVKLS